MRGMQEIVRFDFHGNAFVVSNDKKIIAIVADQAVGVAHALFVEDFADSMRLMAINANGDEMRRFFPQLAFDDLGMHLFDLAVALHAGLGEVLGADRGARVGVRQNVVSRVATGADGGYREAFFKQPLAVNALGIIFNDFILRNVAYALNF